MRKPSDSEPAVVALPTVRARKGRSAWVWRLAVSGVVLGWLISRTEWAPIVELLAGVRLDLCVLSLGLYCIAQVASSYRWQVLARALGFQERLGRYVALYFIGMFFSLFLPTSVGGDVVRVWFLGGQRGQGWLATLSVLSERFSGLLALLIIACAATCCSLAVLPWWTPWMVWGTTVSACIGLVALPLLGRWSPRCRDLAKGLSFYRGHLANWTGAFLMSFVVQGASVVQIWLLGAALGLDVPFLTYAVAVPVVSLLTMLPISINGVGVREGSLTVLLQPAGVAPAGALALGLLWFCMTGAASLLGGGVYLFGRNAQFSRKEWKDTYGPVRGDSDQGREGQSAAAA